MNNTSFLIKIISAIIIIAFIFPLHAKADMMNTKNVGKLTMVLILSATAFLIKKFVNNDIDRTVKIHEEIGKPDRYIEFQRGFDFWRVEWHDESIYVFRNGIFSHKADLSAD